jgi:large subunit ribosomal protein L29
MPRRAAPFRELADGELETRLGETKQELFNLRFQLVTGQLDNTARINHVRKDVARIETILREREIEAAETAQKAGTEEASGASAVTAGDTDASAVTAEETDASAVTAGDTDASAVTAGSEEGTPS